MGLSWQEYSSGLPCPPPDTILPLFDQKVHLVFFCKIALVAKGGISIDQVEKLKHYLLQSWKNLEGCSGERDLDQSRGVGIGQR